MREISAAAVPPSDSLPGEIREVRPGRRLIIAVAAGARDGDPTIFLIHGAGGNKDHWRFQWRTLVAAGCRVVAWDAMGHGASPQPRRRNAYAGSAFIEDYWAILQTYGTRRNILVAHSYGTRLTLCILERLARMGRLDGIAGVLLLGPPSPGWSPPVGAMRWTPSFVLEWMRPRLSRAFRGAAWHPETDPALIDREEAATRRNSLFMMKSLILQGAVPDPAGFAGLTLRIDIAAGEGDRLTPPAGAEALARALPQAVLHRIERAGHQMMLEQPAAIDRLLLELIGRADRI